MTSSPACYPARRSPACRRSRGTRSSTPPAGRAGGSGAGGARRGDGFRVVNSTGQSPWTGSDPEVGDPINLPADDLDLFKEYGTLVGVAPTATDPFVIFQESRRLRAGSAGRGLSGRPLALVTVTDTAHGYAAPTTATDKLTSGATGRRESSTSRPGRGTCGPW